MNSQIYCLPLKYGWNAMQSTLGTREEERERAKAMDTSKPYFTVRFHDQPADDEAIKTFQDQYPRFASTVLPTDQETINAIYQSEYGFKYGSQFTADYRRPPPPTTYEVRADPVARRSSMKPPMSSIRPLPSEMNDPDRGRYEWQEPITRPGMRAWPALKKIPVNSEPGVRSTLLPVRLGQHDPTHEKERWDTMRHLDRKDALSYNYRKSMPGYTGHRQTDAELTCCAEKGACLPKLGMTTTTQATHRRFPKEEYRLPSHDAATRMVTLM